MMWQEFEALAGYEVTYEDYTNIIEPMYMATSLSKQEFVKCIDKKRFALKTQKELVREMRTLAKQIAEEVEHTGAYELKRTLEEKVRAYAKRFHGYKDEDFSSWYGYEEEYTYPTIQRGCRYPVAVCFGRDRTEYERLTLIKQ